ncbi:MAG: phosphoribulokinase [Clostridia bacterium]|nr:phosphoribulokinase [Clostridia bacterium]
MKNAFLFRLNSLLARQDRVLVAIDGRCGAGKTTFSAALEEAFGATVIHMDDFFLQPKDKTPERLAEPGVNLDRERFRKEVLMPLLAGESFSFRPYLCSKGELGEPVAVKPARLVVVEGSYSLHPAFGEPYDLTAFLTVSPEVQRERILTRPERLHRRFFEEWIPMEEAYFEHFSIPSRADYVIYHARD